MLDAHIFTQKHTSGKIGPCTARSMTLKRHGVSLQPRLKLEIELLSFSEVVIYLFDSILLRLSRLLQLFVPSVFQGLIKGCHKV